MKWLDGRGRVSEASFKVVDKEKVLRKVRIGIEMVGEMGMAI